MERKVEILQISNLEDYDWPSKDPHSVSQRTRPMVDKDLVLVKNCLKSALLNMDAFFENSRKENLSLTNQIMKFLSHQKIQMNPISAVRNDSRWVNCINHSISNGTPIDIVYPQFCVIPNAPKRYTNIGYTAGEDCTIEFFKQINTQFKMIYSPGIRFHILTDASLYASAFNTQQTEVNAYYESLKSRIVELNAEKCIYLYDYADLIRTHFHQEYLGLYYDYSRKVWSGNIQDLIPETDADTLRRSVRCSVNTRRFQLKYEDHLRLFGPVQFRDMQHHLYNTLDNMTEIALHEVISIRLACTQLDISSLLWPNAIRATCHKGAKNGHWPIGLKTYPEYYGSCKLLPYHGMPLITKDKKGKPKLEIYPEVVLRGRDDLIRITIGSSDEVYAYITNDIEHDDFLSFIYSTPKGMRLHGLNNRNVAMAYYVDPLNITCNP